MPRGFKLGLRCLSKTRKPTTILSLRLVIKRQRQLLQNYTFKCYEILKRNEFRLKGNYLAKMGGAVADVTRKVGQESGQ